ncbi:MULTISPECIES: glycosyltransferase family 2 protein [unclassified Nostoc]|uniref:glycosyltransferase family 2 protein n=1 Tax=unclassified Nostoc TaxID=2593658 RepID=UPI002628CCAC|nr:glycosyltransferase family 2 protein [Nostoc sp. S13]MDF5735654.1 glycosyltransferase family 2 protein [Nostoc sp. S13]
MSDMILVSVVMPCLNEEAAIGSCIEKIQNTFNNAGIDGEIVVCDNGSTDSSVEIAKSMGVRVVHQSLRGYGNAYLKGFNSARGKYFIMGDADDTYDFRLIPQFLDAIVNENYDFVTGSRFLGKKGLENNPLLHRLIGNPAITSLLNGLFGTKYTDVYCGLRAFSREVYELIQPISPGMEFNLELAINAGFAKLKIKEIPIQLAPRKGESKLRTLRDGWRSLRMMLLYAPNKLFVYPGMFLLTLGMLIHIAVLADFFKYEGRSLGVVTGIFATIFSVVGFQILSLGLHAKTYSWSRRFDQDNFLLRKFYNFFNLETGLLIGTSMIIGGSSVLLYLTLQWLRFNLLPLPHPEWFTFAATVVIIGFEIDFSSLFISAMSMKKVERYEVPR